MPKRATLVVLAISAFCVCAHSSTADSDGGSWPSVLTWREAVEEALQRSSELQQARLEISRAELNEPLLLAELDPRFEGSYSFVDDQSPRAAPLFEGERSRRERFGFGLRQRTLLGTDANLTWDNDRLKNPTPFRALDPSAESILTLSVRQPLLRYFWGRPDVARRRRLRANVESLQLALRAREMNAAFAAAQAYFEVYFAGERIRIGEAAVAQAERLVKKQKEKKRYGLVEESALWQTEASLEIEQTELQLARSDFERAQNALRAALNRQKVEEPQPVAVVLAEDLPEVESNLDSALRTGLAERGEVRASRAAVEAARWALRTEKLDTLPELSLSGSYGIAGLNRTYRGAWDDISDDHTVRSVGLSFSTPFLYKRERLTRRHLELQLQTAEREAERVEQQTIRDIRDAWESWTLRQERLEARERLLRLQRSKLKAEEQSYARGRSSTDLLVRFQQDIHRAEQDLARAKVELILARLALSRATGKLVAEAKDDR